ncbi:two-component system sensor histidine kinase NtrB [Desulfobacula sp.]
MKLGFRGKIYVAVFSLLLIQGIVIFFWVSQVIKDSMLDEIKNQGILIGISLSARMTDPILAMDFLRMKVLVDETVELDDDIFYTFVLDEKGTPLIHTFKDGFPIALKTANHVSDHQKRSIQLLDMGDQLIYDYAVPILINGDRLGTLRLGLSQTRAEKVVNKIMASTGITIILSILLAWIVGTMLLKPVTKNIKKRHDSSEQTLRGNLDVILDAIPDFITLQDREGIYVSVNRAFCKILNKNKEDIVGRTNDDLFSKNLAELFTREDKNILETKIPLVKENKLTGSKNVKWLHVVKIPVLEAKNRVQGLVCSGRDITQLKAVQEQLTQAQKMESIGRMAAGIAHEINTPLGIILGYAQLLLEDVEKNGQIYNDVITIVKQTKNCSKIVADLLNFSHSSESIITTFNINDAIKEVLEMVEHTFSLNHVMIQANLHKNPLLMKGDKEKLKQVVINLLNNAFDAIEKNGKIFISTGAQKKESKIKISITDTGTGIAKENINRIFEPFYTTKGPDKGTGLGLSVTFGIIKEHNGTINVFSPPISGVKEKKGTQFIVVLPTGLNGEKGE